MRGRVTWSQRSYPYRPPGAGVALLTFCVLLLVWTFKACVVVAKWIVVALVAVVAAAVGFCEMVREKRARRR